MITLAEYDANGDVFHVAEVLTAEGPGVPPAPLGDPDAAAAHADAVAQLVAQREAATVAALQQRANAGARLVVVGPGETTRPSRLDPAGRWQVVKGKLTRRTDAQLDSWRAAQAAAAANGPK